MIDLKDVRLLFVDDDPFMIETFPKLMKNRLKDVRVVSNGEDALEALGLEEFDAVLTDLDMPGLPGGELVRLIRQQYPSLAVLVITGFADQAEQVKDAAVILTKPLDRKVIEEAIRSAVGK